MLLKQSTSATVLVGPVLDSTGAAVTTAAIGDFNITKNGTSAAMSGNTISHSHNGHYLITLTTTDTNTIGRLAITVNNTSYAMTAFRWDVITATAFDTLVTNGTLASTTSGRTISVDASGNLTVGGYASGQAPLQPTVSGRTLDVSLSGEAGIDWSNIGSPTTSVNFSGTTISTSQAVASVSGAVGSVTSGVTVTTNNDKTGYSLASGGLAAVTTWSVNITGSLSGSVGSVTGNVGGNVTGSIASIASGGITSSSFATDSITATALAASAVTEIQSGLSTLSTADIRTAVGLASANLDTQLADLPTVAEFEARSIVAANYATSANQTIIIDGIGYTLAQVQGAVSSPQTSTPVYATSFNGSTYTVTHTGVTSTGVRGTAVRSKS